MKAAIVARRTEQLIIVNFIHVPLMFEMIYALEHSILTFNSCCNIKALMIPIEGECGRTQVEDLGVTCNSFL